MASSNISERPRPRSLARYIAASASRSILAGAWASRPTAMPTEAEQKTSPEATANGCSQTSAMRSAISKASSSDSTSASTTNSSPPRRATVSEERTTSVRREPTSMSSSSPAWWPSESLTVLKPSTSSSSTATPKPKRSARPKACSTRSKSSARLGRPVSASCSDWWRMTASERSRSSAEARRSAIDCSHWPSSPENAPTVAECTPMTPKAPERPRMAAAAVARIPCPRRLGTLKRRSLAHSQTMIGSSPASTWPAKRCSSAGTSAPTSKPTAATASMCVPSGCSSRMAQCSTRSVSVSTRTVSSSSSVRSVARSARPARRAMAASRWARSRSEAARRASASARSLSETMRSRSERPSSRVSW